MGMGQRKVWNLVSAEYLGQPSLCLGRWAAVLLQSREHLCWGSYWQHQGPVVCAFTLWDWKPKLCPFSGSGWPSLLVRCSGEKKDQCFSKKQLFSMQCRNKKSSLCKLQYFHPLAFPFMHLFRVFVACNVSVSQILNLWKGIEPTKWKSIQSCTTLLNTVGSLQTCFNLC